MYECELNKLQGSTLYRHQIWERENGGQAEKQPGMTRWPVIPTQLALIISYTPGDKSEVYQPLIGFSPCLYMALLCSESFLDHMSGIY